MDEASAIVRAPVRRKRVGRRGITVVLLIGLALMSVGVLGAAHGFHERSLLRSTPGWVRTTGTIERVSTHCFRGCVYAATISFVDSGGTRHEFTAPNGDSRPPIGSPVNVDYDPLRPSRAHDLSQSGSNWTFEIATMIFIACLGLGMLSLGTWAARRFWRHPIVQ